MLLEADTKEAKDFRHFIRAYNSMFQMAYSGVQAR